MGACCSKTDSTITSKPTPPEIQPEKKNNAAVAIVASPTEQEALKKDVFMVKHRKSHEIDRHPGQETRKSIDRKKTPNSCPNSDISKSAITNSAESGGVSVAESGKVMGATVRTSSCTKEEVDAILIQCGRLSRSSSGVNPAGGETPTRGRRYSGSKRSFDFDDDEVAVVVDGDNHRQQREPRVSSPSSRRRSRERDSQQQRSGSKERGSGTGGRRVSRSPNRRSESPVPNCTATAAATTGGNRPGKMVSVPATDKTGGGEAAVGVTGGVKKTQVKRTASEAARPVTVRVLNENQNPNPSPQPFTLSRSNSRKAEQSPYKRNPLGEIDTNVIGPEQPSSKKPNGEKTMTDQIVSRTRSSRLSRELNIKPEALTNPSPNPDQPSYASLLLEDIQNFHHKNLSTCVNKASNDQQLKVVDDDIMEPSLHKYVTVRRGGGDADTEEQESSGSNSFAGSQQLSWMSSSWEPSSGDSADCWTSKSRSGMEFEKSGEYPRNGIGRGRVGVNGRSAYSLPNNVGST